MTTVWACEKTVVMVKQPGHLTSMKKDRGAGTRVCECGALDGAVAARSCRWAWASYLELVLLGLGGRRRIQEINGENLIQVMSANLALNHRFHCSVP